MGVKVSIKIERDIPSIKSSKRKKNIFRNFSDHMPNWNYAKNHLLIFYSKTIDFSKTSYIYKNCIEGNGFHFSIFRSFAATMSQLKCYVFYRRKDKSF